MIITISAHGRTCNDVIKLADHLSKTVSQSVKFVASNGIIPNQSIHTSLIDLSLSTSLSRKAQIGLQHVTLNPAKHWTASQRDQVVARVLQELKAEDHPWILVEHADKRRAAPGGASTHFHFIVAHVGPHGRAIDTRNSYARLEAVARTCEVDFGERITASRRARAVSAHLISVGRADVASAVMANTNSELPRSAMTSEGRQRAKRVGIDLPALRATVKAAWAAPNLIEALDVAGLSLALGERRGAILVCTRGGLFIGALDRLAGVGRIAAAKRVGQEMPKEINTQKGAENERRKRSRSTKGRAWQAAFGEYQVDKDNIRNNSVNIRVFRGRIGSGDTDEDRGEDRNGNGYSAPTAKQRGAAVVAIRLAEIAARRRREAGSCTLDEIRAYKLDLWRRIVGYGISPEVGVALAYVDVANRIAHLINGGWLRDEGKILYASGADPTVVALMVASSIAKGWKSVTLSGSAAFLSEARPQYEAAGIDVVIDGNPPQTYRPRADKMLVAEMIAILQKKVEAARC